MPLFEVTHLLCSALEFAWLAYSNGGRARVSLLESQKHQSLANGTVERIKPMILPGERFFHLVLPLEVTHGFNSNPLADRG